MSTAIHPSAIVDPAAELGPGVQVGPGAVIGAQVEIGAGTRIGAYAVLDGRLSLGADNQVSPHAVLGAPPQDVKYAGEPTRVEIGDRNRIREFVTVHRGTPQGRGVTRIGSDTFLMAYSHVAHDAIVEDHAILANAVQLAGHVQVMAWAIVGGCSAVHQFARIGPIAFVGGGSMVELDVPPFCMATGNRARLHGLNTIGLKRRGFGKRELAAAWKAYRLAFKSGLLLDEAIARIEAELLGDCEALGELTGFLRSSERGVTR
ncbi:MAG: acyl-ACP--UDP-N-acetylglucosamine O-acyltransferase [Deltaproteobacteria bacterium]|nr:acyl-ACP--UDP-N-acetylglucosamine O-acyltransferase [Deltaproteobacteria bacterium]